MYLEEDEDFYLWSKSHDREFQLAMSEDEDALEGSAGFIVCDSAVISMADDMSTTIEDHETFDSEEPDVRDEALECVEELVLSYLSQLSEALPNAYNQSLPESKGCNKKVVLRLADRTKEHFEDTPQRQLMYPRQTREPSAKPFAQLFRVADLIHEALLEDLPTTKRDMYYKDVQLFRSQGTVDKLVDDLVATFQLSRADLNVRASSKGLLCGSGLAIHLKSGDVLRISDSEASLIPPSEDIAQFEVGESLTWVLVVEKEAVFQTLCKLRFAVHEALPGPGLIMTGKGYPDVATRQLVRTLSDNLPSGIPILALVDGDAYGIDILSVYKYGSMRMKHENEHLAAARVQWLGLWGRELASLGIEKEVLLPITKHDEKKARSMLKREYLPAQWRKELQHMLFSRRKAEIEVLGAASASRDVNQGAGCDRPIVGGNAGIPLVRYLVVKIRAACADLNHEIS